MTPTDADVQSHGMSVFRKLLKKLPLGAYTCDPFGVVTYFNPPAEQLWGRAPLVNNLADRYTGAYQLLDSEGAPLRREDFCVARALLANEDCSGETSIIVREDGSQCPVVTNVNLIHSEQGELLGAVNIMLDITGQLRGDKAQAQLAAIVESSVDAIVGKSLDGCIRSWNAGAERLFGYRAEDVIGKSITILIPPERQSEEAEILNRIRRGERIEHFETVRISKDGRRLDISLTISPIRDLSGKIIGASKIARDVSTQKQQEQAVMSLKNELALQLIDLQRLHEMSVRLSGNWDAEDLKPTLQEVLRTATAIHGTELGLLWLTPVDADDLGVISSLGFTPDILETLQALPQANSEPGIDPDGAHCLIVEDTETDPRFAEFRDISRRAGFRSMSSTALRTRLGKVLGVLSTFQTVPHRTSERELRLTELCVRQAVDFIESARLYTKLREADRRKDEFLATLAHELRNPLAPISNSLHIMRLAGDLGPTGDSMRGIMERQVTHLTRLVDDLMEVSRVARGRIELRKEPTNLTTIVGTAIESCRPLIEAARHHFTANLYNQPLMLDADPVRLTQVVSNLLNNAVKYTPQGGQIWLDMRVENGSAVISVTDTGMGISSNMLARVFDMFAQIDRTLTRSQGGLGIGLTLARTFVEMHGGKIEARSAGLNQGSEFVVTLPLASEAVRPTLPAAATPSNQPLPAHRILIVDDMQSSAYTLGRLLEKLGQAVFQCNDSRAALEQVETLKPDIVISDIAMPDMDGYELAKRIRDRSHSNLVLVALTGYSQSSDRARSLAAGFDYHLVKPVGLEELQALLRSVTARSHKN